MSATHRLVSDLLYSMMLVHFKCDERAVEAEIRLYELQCASSNPTMRHLYDQVASETGVAESTIRFRHKAFMEQLRCVRALVPSIDDRDLVNAAASGDCGG
mgnify:CR=1 FL=1